MPSSRAVEALARKFSLRTPARCGDRRPGELPIRSRFRSGIASVLVGWIAVLFTGPSAHAQSSSWTGGSLADGNWSSALNWLGGAAPGATSGTTSLDIATFNAAIANTWGDALGNPIVNDSGRNIGGLNFDLAAGNYFLGATGGNSLLLSSGGAIQILSTLTATNAVETVNAPLVFQGANGTYTFANNSANGSGAGAGTLNFGGGITGGAAGATVLTLGGSNTNANTISGIIANGSATSLAITKSDAGAWTLSGANTYTGTTTVNSGTLTGTQTGGTPFGTGAITLNGGVLRLAPTGSGSDVTLTGASAAAGTLFTIAGGATLSLNKGVQTSLTYTVGGTGTVLARANNGTLVLVESAAGTLGSPTGERFLINGTAPAAISTNANLVNLPMVVQNSPSDSTANFLKYDAANGFLSTAANYTTVSGTAPTTATGAIWNVTASASVTGTVTRRLGAIRVGAVTLTIGTGTTAKALSLGSAAGDLAPIILNGGTIRPATANSSTQTLTLFAGAETPVYTSSAGGILSVPILGTGSSLTLFGPGTLTLSGGSSTFTGGVTLNSGTVNINKATALGTAAGTFVINGGAIDNTSGAAITTSSYPITINADITFLGGTGTTHDLNLGAGATPLGTAAGASRTITTNAGTLTLGGVVGNGTSANSLIKAGAGTLVLSGANTYNGGTTITAGILSFANGSLSTAGNITMNGGTLQWNGSNTQDISSRLVMVNATTATFDTNGNNVTLASGFGGSTTGALAKTGTGTLTLAGAITYSGATTVSAGTLLFTQTQAMPATSAVSVSSGTTLAVNAGGSGEFTNGTSGNGTIGGLLSGLGSQSGSTVSLAAGSFLGIDTTNAGGSLTYSGNISNSGLGITKLGTGTLILPGAHTYSGSTTISAGTLQLDNNLALQNSAIDTSGAGVIALSAVTTPTFGGLIGSRDLSSVITTGYGGLTALTLNPGTGATNSYSGAIADGAAGMSLTKSGAGTQILGGANTFTGATSVGQGTLIVNGSTASGSAVTVAGGTTLGGSGTVAGTVAANGIIAPGAGLAAGDYAALRTGAISFSGTGSLVLNVGAGGNDSLVVNGTYNLASTLTLNAVNPGQSINVLLSATSITGAFTTLPAIPTGYGLQVTPTQITLGKLVITAPSLTASDAAANDSFGNSVSQSGTIGLVGAYAKNSFQGAAYLFRGLDTATGTATQNVKLTASDAANGDGFGYSVSQSGTIGLVGAYFKNSAQGAAYLFRGLDTATGTVTQNVKLTASDGAANDGFGYSVSQSGTIGLVGAFNKNASQGAAYLFRDLDTASGTVTQNVKLTASDGASGDEFGYSVSQSGTIGLVGAFNKNASQGAAYLFRGLDTASGTVTQNVKLTASDGAANDGFGYSVSQSGTIGLVGAFNKNASQGAAYLFRDLDTASGTVTQNVKLTASDGASGDEFGYSVSQSGTIGLVGAFNKNASQGAAYLFRGLDTASGTVTQNVKLTASDGASGDEFGYSVSQSGDQFTIGAIGKNSSAGKAYTGTVSSVTTLDLGSATRTIDGISFVTQDDWIIGQTTSNNQVTLNAGNNATVTAGGKAVYVGQNAGSNNNTLVIAGTLTANQITIGTAGNTGNVLQLGTGGTTGSLSVGGAITDNGRLVFNRSDTITQGTDFGSAAIAGSGGVTQAGSGTTVLNAANTYTGTTTISAGTLTISGSGSFASSPTITVGSGATLDVSGVVSGLNSSGGLFALAGGQTLTGKGTATGSLTVLSGATLSPGAQVTNAAPGALTVNGTTPVVTLDTGSKFAFYQNTTPTPTAAPSLSGGSGVAGIINNVLIVQGALAVADPTHLTILVYGDANKFNPTQSYSFLVGTASGGITPSFGVTNQSQFDTTGFLNNSGQFTFSLLDSGNNLYFELTPVPEPGSILALAAGALGVGGYVRRRRRAGFSSVVGELRNQN